MRSSLMRYRVAGVLVVLGLLGCAAQDIQNALPFVPKSTTTQTKTVPEAPAIAYDRSITAIRTIGGVVTQLQADTHRISAQLSGGGITFTVVVTPDGTGSVLTASQRVSVSHSAYLPVRVCDQFFAAYAR
jgi:hypothetical protein